MVFKEAYSPHPLGVDATFRTDATQLGGFITKTAGTITVVNANGTTVVDAVPVAAGQYLPLPLMLKLGGTANNASSVTLAGGASGTLLV